jgi:flagellar motor switch protein FliN
MAEEEPQEDELQAEEPQVEEPQAEEPQAEEPQAEEPQAEEPQAEDPQAEEPQAEALPEQPHPAPPTEGPLDGGSQETFRAEFEQLPVLDLGELEKFVNRYDDVPVKVSIELGRVTKTLQDIVEWKEGSIVETKKLSGMPMEIMVNGSLFGHGEVVVVGDNLAIRITDLEKPNLD